MSRFQPTPAYRLFLALLVKARTDASVTQEELANRLGIAPAQVAAFESGAQQLDFVQTREWCQALGVSFLDFMVKLDREIAAQLPDAFTTSAPDADPPEQTEGGAA